MDYTRHKNILIRGNVGSGKTFWARALAYYICVEKIELNKCFNKSPQEDIPSIDQFLHSDRCELIQIYPSMSYDDIVYGLDIRVNHSLVLKHAPKRVMKLCDDARGKEELFCVILDDLNRANVSCLLGNLLYCLFNRNQTISLTDGVEFAIPNNVIFIFTASSCFSGNELDKTFLQSMDYIHDIQPNQLEIVKYYRLSNQIQAASLCESIWSEIKVFLESYNSNPYEYKTKDLLPGNGYFLVPSTGAPEQVRERIRERCIFQLFPFIQQLWANSIIKRNPDSLFRKLIQLISPQVQDSEIISTVRKTFVTSQENATDYTLEDTFEYFTNTIIPNNCSEYRGILECIADAILLNGILPCDIVWNSLLTNIGVGFIENSFGQKSSYLVELRQANDFFYTTPRNGRRVVHSYYSPKPARVGRWKSINDSIGYQTVYADGHKSQTFIMLNGLRCHNFTIDQARLHPINNTAEIYRAVYRLIESYINLYLISIEPTGDEDLFNLITLEKKYIQTIHAELGRFSGDVEKQRFFVSKYSNLKTLWKKKTSILEIDSSLFSSLISGDIPFSLSSYENLFLISKKTSIKTIELKGVNKMIELTDYQKVMDNIGVRQMIFQGPPGTSKTFESKNFILSHLDSSFDPHDSNVNIPNEISSRLDSFKLSDADYNDPRNSPKIQSGGWDLVQFHPSYGYEDFIRGIEVKAIDGSPSYSTTNRILGKIAEFARISNEMKSNAAFYLLIDEINRANLAAVFGELIYGLEYRNSAVSTPYEVVDKALESVTRDIILPKNLYIVGTMNTADKSIDAIDYAIRRRFITIDSPARRDTVLSCYRDISGKDDDASIELFLFDAVQAIFDNDLCFNTEYQKNDVRLGHTFFLRTSNENYLEMAIERFIFQVIPILREYLKDGIIIIRDDASDMTEYSVGQILGDERDNQISKFRDNILLYIKNYGNTNSQGDIYDNTHIGRFIDELSQGLGY